MNILRRPLVSTEKIVEFLIGACIVPSSHLLSKQMMRSKPHALASTPATPKKNVSCFFDLAGVKFFLKVERTFFFGVLPSKYSGSAWGFNADSVLPKLFSGEKDLAKPRLNFPARRKGSRE